MKKTLITIIAFMTLLLLPIRAMAGDLGVDSDASLRGGNLIERVLTSETKAIADSNSGTIVYRLESDVTLSGELIFVSGAIVTIDLQGYNLYIDTRLTVPTSSSLRVYDSSRDMIVISEDNAVLMCGEVQLTENGEISGGTYDKVPIVNNGCILNGVFNDTIENNAEISGGEFNLTSEMLKNVPYKSKFTNETSATISDGIFNTPVNNFGSITGGTFNEEVVNNSGTIENARINGGISGNNKILVISQDTTFDSLEIPSGMEIQIKEGAAVTINTSCVIKGALRVYGNSKLEGAEGATLEIVKGATVSGTSLKQYNLMSEMTSDYPYSTSKSASFHWRHTGFKELADTNTVAEDSESAMGWLLDNWITFNFYSPEGRNAYVSVNLYASGNFTDIELYAYNGLSYNYDVSLDYKLYLNVPKEVMAKQEKIEIVEDIGASEPITFDMSKVRKLQATEAEYLCYELTELITLSDYHNVTVNIYWNEDIKKALTCKNHDVTWVEKVPSVCDNFGYEAHYQCKNCGGWYNDTLHKGYTDPEDFRIHEVAHDNVPVEAKTPTCAEIGCLKHYYCKQCHKTFEDEEGLVPFEESAWTIAKIAHKPVKMGAKEATYTKKGNIEYFKCSSCNNLFADEKCTKEIAPSDTEIKPIALTNKGAKITDKKKKTTYVITTADLKKGTVELSKFADTTAVKCEVPKTITYNGVKYKVTSIGNSVFSGKKNLSRINIKADIMSIGKAAFKNCKTLTSITIPKNVSKIGASAFEGCKELRKVDIKTKLLTSKNLGNKAFKGIGKDATIIVPKKKLTEYIKFLYKKGIKNTMQINGK